MGIEKEMVAVRYQVTVAMATRKHANNCMQQGLWAHGSHSVKKESQVRKKKNSLKSTKVNKKSIFFDFSLTFLD